MFRVQQVNFAPRFRRSICNWRTKSSSMLPVEFQQHHVQLWLPESASLCIAHRGHRYERVHTFSQYQLFAVDAAQAIKNPPADSDVQVQ